MDNKTIIKLLDEFGFLMLNEHKSLPSLIEVDGTWGDMMELIRTRRIFLSKLIDKKTTLLSSDLYFTIRSSVIKLNLSCDEEVLLEFIRKNEPVSTDIIMLGMNKDKKTIDKLLYSLQSQLLVTVIDEGKRLNKNWGTYQWGTSEYWERDYLRRGLMKPEKDLTNFIEKMRHNNIDEKYIQKLIGKSYSQNPSKL